MKNLKLLGAVIISCSALLFASQAWAKPYAHRLCKSTDYKCTTIRPGQSWQSLFPNDDMRDIVMRLNRMNVHLSPGMVIAVPKNLRAANVWDVSPFPRYIEAPGEKIIYVSQRELAWGAYNPQGRLLWWGPISSGQDFCVDTQEGCRTPKGEYRMLRKQGAECESSKFPIETMGGAPMPYCMHFYGGFALHASAYVPGHRASHGCVRLFVEDARWLNEEFIEVPGEGKNGGTRVVIGPA